MSILLILCAFVLANLRIYFSKLDRYHGSILQDIHNFSRFPPFLLGPYSNEIRSILVYGSGFLGIDLGLGFLMTDEKYSELDKQ